MQTQWREQIRQSLGTLAATYRSTIDLMEQTFSLLCEQGELELLGQRFTRSLEAVAPIEHPGFLIDPSVFTVTFRRRPCFLGNSYPFKFLYRLAQRPNTYVSYESLLDDVWKGLRSDENIRSVAKTLRSRLRSVGPSDLAAAVDGRVARHYALKLPL